LIRRLLVSCVLPFSLLIACGLLTTLHVRSAQAQSAPLEYQVKAALLYQFAKFVEWPAQTFEATQNALCIGVIENDLMANALSSIEGKEVKGRRIVIKQVKPSDPMDFCHILFIGSGMEDRLKGLLDRLKATSTLTVGDLNGFARRGGMIGLLTVENKIRFEINLEAAERAHLQISSHLLRLARIVTGGR